MALSASLLAKIDTWLGQNQAVQSDDDKIDFVLEVTPVKLATSTPEKLYFSVGGYRGVTGSKKSPPRLIAPSLSISLLNETFARELPDGTRELAQFLPGELQIGTWELVGPDGELDYLASDYGWGDAAAELKVGRKGDAYTAFETFLAFKVREEPRYNLDRLTFESKPALVNWNAPVQTTVFAGTGGYEGGSDLVGTTKPLLLGRRRFFPAQLTEFSTLSYALSDATDGLQSIQDAYEGGHEGVLFTAALASGGMTLTNQATQGAVSADAEGEKFDGGVYAAGQGKVLQEVFQRVAAAITFNATDLAAHTDTVGIHLPAGNSMTLKQAAELLTRPLQVVFPAQDASEWHIKTVSAPPGSPAVTYRKADIAKDGLEVSPAAPPVWRVRVCYQSVDAPRPDTPLTENATVQEFLSADCRYKQASDATVLTDYPNALDLVIPSQLDDATQAQTAADTALALFKVPRRRYRLTLAAKWFHSYLMEELSLEYDRYGLDAGKDLWMVGAEVRLGQISGDAVGSYILEAWG